MVSAAAAALGIALAATAEDKDDKKTEGPPPLIVDTEAPLMLEDPKPGEKEAEEPAADNSACHVCHGNYREEPLAVWHAEADVGCVECHGESIAHCNDEDNITPPDRIYGLDAIDDACGVCHDSHDVPAAEVIARWRKRCPEKTDPKQVVCTDCHGQHRLKLRTVRWDKKTRKLIVGEEQEKD